MQNSNIRLRISNKHYCDRPAYLFWKLQSRLVRLQQQLHRLENSRNQTHDSVNTQVH